MYLAPIVLFVYNRPWHTRQTLESLMANDLASESQLFIYSDGPKDNATEEQLQKIKDVRKLIREKKWCSKVEIIERNNNLGVDQSTIICVSEIINKYGEIIVLEDDLLLGRGFLKYMNEALALYKNTDKVMHISGYMFPLKYKTPENFFLRLTSCWGWATWERAWSLFNPSAQDLLNKLISINSVKKFKSIGFFDHIEILEKVASGAENYWDIRWHTSVFLNNGLCLHPYLSLVRNIGFDGSGVHCKVSNLHQSQHIGEYIQISSIPIEESKKIEKEIFDLRDTSYIYKIKKMLCLNK